MAETQPDIFILAGPNEAGKTTAAKILLPRKLHVDAFLNADEFARRTAPSNVESAAFEAGREMLETMRARIRDQVSFAFETTCADKSYVKLLNECRRDGWRISLIYLLDSVPGLCNCARSTTCKCWWSLHP